MRAPAEGVLTGFEAHVGEEKVRGQHLGQIDRDSGFKVTVLVDEFYLARVKQGLPIAVTVDGAPGTLTVSKIYPQVKNGKFEIDLTWEGARPSDLRRGRQSRVSSNWAVTHRGGTARGTVPGGLRRRLGLRGGARRLIGRAPRREARPAHIEAVEVVEG